MILKKKILVIGDVMLDRYWMGQVNRISPEAPVPILDVDTSVDKPGGAANVAKNLSDFGTVSFFSISTLTTGIYNAWISFDDLNTANQLSFILLIFIASAQRAVPFSHLEDVIITLAPKLSAVCFISKLSVAIYVLLIPSTLLAASQES